VRSEFRVLLRSDECTEPAASPVPSFSPNTQQEAHRAIRSDVRRGSDDLGTRPVGRREAVPAKDRLVSWLSVICLRGLLTAPPFATPKGVPFPKHFQSTCRAILRRLFRVYAHIYYEHFDQICALGIEGEPADVATSCLSRPLVRPVAFADGLPSSRSPSQSPPEHQLPPLFPLCHRVPARR
jgi:MOB kinase activator 1